MGMPYAEVIGDPIGHSKSPVIHRFWLHACGLEGDYRAAHVPHEQLPAYFAARRSDPDWRGCNVTVPHKQAVMPLVDRVTPFAREVGAVNIVRASAEGLVGDNSDVAGILDALGSWPPGRTACLIGSGGAALAALAAFRALGVAFLWLNVRDLQKGAHLLAGSGLEGQVGRIDEPDGLRVADLIVNATVLGMAGQEAMPPTVLQEVAARAPGSATVFDAVYVPLDTELLAAARRSGLRTADGLAMLIGQAAAAFEGFFWAPAPRGRDAELRAMLAS